MKDKKRTQQMFSKELSEPIVESVRFFCYFIIFLILFLLISFAIVLSSKLGGTSNEVKISNVKLLEE